MDTGWEIVSGGRRLRVFGPFRDANGRIHQVSATQQQAWAQTFGARLPTAAEFDQIWLTADVRVPPHTHPGGIGPATSLDDDARKAGGKPGDRIAAGKTWLDEDGSGPLDPLVDVTNYGFYVPASELLFVDGVARWKSIKAHPSATLADWWVLQAPGHAHNPAHADYSQAGYAVRDEGPA